MVTCPSCGSDSPGVRGMVMSVFCADAFHDWLPGQDHPAIARVKKLEATLVAWYKDDDIATLDHTCDPITWRKQGERYEQLLDLGILP